VTRTFLFAILVSVAASSAAAVAQEPPTVPPTQPPVTAPPDTPPQTPQTQMPPPQTAPPETAPAAAPEPQFVPPTVDEATIKQRRTEIQNMEGVLASAVRGAAKEIALELQSPETGPFLLSGAHRARGFHLDGYGVFFHVEIPGVQPSLISPVVLKQLEDRLNRQRDARPEAVSAGDPTPGAPANRDAVYVERVKNALMRAMIQYSKPLSLRPDEWLTVAASDGDEPMLPTVLTEQAVMILRIRGRDINEYLAERVSLDEVLKRVEVRRF
jgi:hypothetical protein